jgi:NAD-dependent dihydropyrimidine dehydrogenase PreA subunit
MASSSVSDQEVYNALQIKFGYPKSKRLRKLIEAVFSPQEAQLCLELPGTADEVAKKLNLDVEAVTLQLDNMASVGSIHRVAGSDDRMVYQSVYGLEAFCDSMMWSMAPDWDDEKHNLKTERNRHIADLFHDFYENEWFRFARTDELIHRRIEMLGGPNAMLHFTVTPAWKALEKSKAEPPPEPAYDMRYVAKTAKEQGQKIYAGLCTCKVRARLKKVPVWTCISAPADYLIPANWAGHPKQVYKEWDPDEWLEMMGRCEEEFGFVHMGLPPALYDVCTCDTECCNIFKPLKTYAHCYEGVEKGPYRSVVNKDLCKGQANCLKRCRFEAITMQKDPASGKNVATVNYERCTGCGQCVIGCKVDGAIRLELR